MRWVFTVCYARHMFAWLSVTQIQAALGLFTGLAESPARADPGEHVLPAMACHEQTWLNLRNRDPG
jgi:hypothetical protein